LLEKSMIRIGNDEYAKANQSFGLTTLRDRHVQVKGSTLRFEFRGKSGKRHSVAIDDRRLARIVMQCRDLPGQELFQYIDDRGVRRDVTSSDVNAYLKQITGCDYTAKDFRTWNGTVLAASALAERPPCAVLAHVKKNIVRAVEAVAGVLGNTPAVCRTSYIHPAIFEAYAGGGFPPPRRSRLRLVSKLRAEEVLALTIVTARGSGSRRSHRRARGTARPAPRTFRAAS
jgi:DNA topoisomerase-1